MLLKLTKKLIKPQITPTIKRVHEYVAICVSAGGAVAEERWCFGVQHLHSDSSREWGAGSLGPWHLPLPLTCATGKALEPHGHDCKCKNHKVKPFFLFFRSLTSVLKACLEPAFHLSSCVSSRGSVPSWAGSRRKLQPRSPTELTATLSASLSLSSWKTNPRARALARGSYETAKREQWCLYYDTLCALTGQCWQRAPCAVYSICLLTAAL